MEEEIKEQRKACPTCNKKYSGGDNFCPNDGARLVLAETTGSLSKPRMARDTDPDLQSPSTP